MNWRFFRDITVISFLVSRVYNEYIIFFASLLLIHYLFRWFTMNWLSSKWFREIDSDINVNSQTRYWIDSDLSISRIHSEFPFCFPFFSNTLAFDRIHFEFTIFFANLHWTHYLYSEFSTNSLLFLIWDLSSSQIHFECIIYFANHFKFIISFTN